MNLAYLLFVAGLLIGMGYSYYRWVTRSRLNPRQLWLVPALLAFAVLLSVPPDLLTNQSELLAVAISLITGAVGGIVPSLLVNVYRDERGEAWQQGSWLVALIALAFLPIRFGLRALLLGGPVLGGGFTPAVGFNFLVMFLALLVTRSLTLIARTPPSTAAAPPLDLGAEREVAARV
jgi:hypothetical protein